MLFFCGETITSTTAINIHERVASYGIEHLYYYNNSKLGTVNASAGEYIEYAFGFYGVYPTVSGQTQVTYSNMKSDIDNGSLLYLMLKGHETYENHHVVAYAYTQLKHVSSNIYAEFVKICDGYSESGKRYVDIDVLTSSDKYWEVNF